MRYFAPTKLSENIKETPEGYLVCLGVPIARTGWQLYADGEVPLVADKEGKIRVYRDSKEVFHADTIASFEGKPFTIEHPKEFLDPINWKDLAKGILQSIRKAPDKDEDGEESLLADVLVTDSLAIQLVKAGLREVSCGYEAAYEQTGDGQGRQTQIVGNHLALVRAGRAGPGYAIHDHKTERLSGMGKLAEKVRNLFSKAAEDAVAATVEFEKTKDEMPKDDDKEKKPAKDDEGKEKSEADGSVSYDALSAMVKDLGEKVAGLIKAKDESESPIEKEEKAKDADVSPGLEERLKRVEELLAKLMESESSEMGDKEDPEKKDDPASVGDEDEEEEASVTSDTAARVEILAPGMAITKDFMKNSLMAAYKTKDGKKVIDSLLGGKAPAFDSLEQNSHLFIGASEILRTQRGVGLEQTRNPKSFDPGMDKTGIQMTAEKMNEINKAFYSQK